MGITQKKGIARGIGVNGRTKEVSGLEGIRIYFNGVDPGPLTVTLRGVRNIMAKYTPNAKESILWKAYSGTVMVGGGSANGSGEFDGKVMMVIATVSIFDMVEFYVEESGSAFFIE